MMENIVRIGSCGTPDVKLYDIILAKMHGVIQLFKVQEDEGDTIEEVQS